MITFFERIGPHSGVSRETSSPPAPDYPQRDPVRTTTVATDSRAIPVASRLTVAQQRAVRDLVQRCVPSRAGEVLGTALGQRPRTSDSTTAHGGADRPRRATSHVEHPRVEYRSDQRIGSSDSSGQSAVRTVGCPRVLPGTGRRAFAVFHVKRPRGNVRDYRRWRERFATRSRGTTMVGVGTLATTSTISI